MKIKFVVSTAALLFGVTSVVPSAGASARGPSNDRFARAAVISATPFEITVDTTGATMEKGEARPSCSSIKGSVWYRFLATADQNMTIEAVGPGKPSVSVYQGDSVEALTEVACAPGQSAAATDFKTSKGQAYFVRLGTARRSSSVDFGLRIADWQEKTLAQATRTVEVPEQNIPLFTIDGRPRAGDPSMYDLEVTVGGQGIKRGVLTFGLVQSQIHQSGVKVPRTATTVELLFLARYDASQRQCLIDEGSGGPCTANSPLKDIGWLTGGEGSRAELVARVTVFDGNQRALIHREVAVPYAGQAVVLP